MNATIALDRAVSLLVETLEKTDWRKSLRDDLVSVIEMIDAATTDTNNKKATIETLSCNESLNCLRTNRFTFCVALFPCDRSYQLNGISDICQTQKGS